jgi:hypothetical protein
VKNFNTYLWGPDEVALMTAVGNKRGRDLYGQEVVSPSADKNSKVAACTRKYGNANVQRLVEAEVTSAKAIGANGPPVPGNTEKSALQLNSQVSDATGIGANGPSMTAPTERSAFQSNLLIRKPSSQPNGRPEARDVLDLPDDFFNSELVTTSKVEQSMQNSTSNSFASDIGCVPLPKGLPNDKQDSLEDFIATCNPREQKLATEITAEEDFFAGWESWS